jgi:hypothetical protein
VPQPDLAAQVAQRAFDAVGDAISSRDYEPFIAMSADDGRFRIFSVLDEYRRARADQGAGRDLPPPRG